MRKTLEEPRKSPALQEAIKAAEEIGCTIGTGYTLGNTEIGLSIIPPEGESFIVCFRPENWRQGGKAVCKAARKRGIIASPEGPGE